MRELRAGFKTETKQHHLKYSKGIGTDNRKQPACLYEAEQCVFLLSCLHMPQLLFTFRDYFSFLILKLWLPEMSPPLIIFGPSSSQNFNNSCVVDKLVLCPKGAAQHWYKTFLHDLSNEIPHL